MIARHVADGLTLLGWAHDILTGKVVIEVTAVLDSATGEVKRLGGRIYRPVGRYLALRSELNAWLRSKAG